MKHKKAIIRLITRASRLACAAVLLLVFLATPQGRQFDQPHAPHGGTEPIEHSTRVEWGATGNASARTISYSPDSKTLVLPAFDSV
jgi:hypothetical protein